MHAYPPPLATPPVRVRLPLFRPVVTYILLVSLGLIFVGQYLSEALFSYDWILILGAKENSLIAQGQVWRLFSAIFIHGGILHIVFNGYALYVLGPELERLYGPLRFSLLFLLAGLAGSVASFLLTAVPSVGASGAIFGLVGAEAVFMYRNRRLLGRQATQRLGNIGLIILLNLAFGLQPGSRLDNWAHLGGLAGGLLLAWFIGPVWAIGQPALGLDYVVQAEDRQPLTGARWMFIALFGLGLAFLTLVGIFGQG